VACVALDDALAGFRPGLIKMDIEGAELDALQGAQEIIQRHRPGLAISAYRRPGPLWEIPMLLDSWRLRYRLHLRLHAYDGFDAVVYAVPA
jgi:hypothetical protein